MPSQTFEILRERLLPMLNLASETYQGRVPSGYPVVVDSPSQGTVGVEIDPSYALYLIDDGDQTYAELYRRAPRNDARSSASRMKHGGAPFQDRRPLTANTSDQTLRNLLAEVMMYFNQQPGLIHISDS